MNDYPLNQQGFHPERMKSRAFTLIELLVVIAIIAILMGLLFPAAQSALNSAKKTTAKNQVIQIATAITGYETEYGRLPNITSITNMGGSGVGTGPGILCTTNDASNNPRGLIFLDSSTWKSGKGGTNATGFLDPWSNVYSVMLDTNYTNGLSFAVAGTTTNLTKHIAVWTVWTNGSQINVINSWD